MTEVETLRATITHLRRQLAVKDQECQRLRSELRQLRPSIEQTNRRDLLQAHKFNQGVER
jgi:predicted RNase H-like nuclease (RuvC/YqgF family)